MPRLEQQVKDLKKERDDLRQTIELQNDRINDLLRQLQGRIEDSPIFKAQMESFQIQQQVKKTAKAELAEKVAKLEAKILDMAGNHALERTKLEERIKNLRELAIIRKNLNDILDKKVNDLQSKHDLEIKKLEEQLTATQKEVDNKQKRLDQLEEIASDNKNLKKQLEEMEDWKSQYEELYESTHPKAKQIENAHRPGPKRRISEETRQKVRDLYRSGKSMGDISKELGMSKSKVHAIVHEIVE